ncbi:MAG: ATP-binding protein, partial [Desulfovibrionaceae bacterium]|nr:ATP-binding protein [Desulfovibrionaceae bacterium]
MFGLIDRWVARHGPGAFFFAAAALLAPGPLWAAQAPARAVLDLAPAWGGPVAGLLAGIVLAGAVALWLARRSFARVKAVVDRVGDLADKADLSSRLDLPGLTWPKALAENINALLDRFEAARRERDDSAGRFRKLFETSRDGLVFCDLEQSVLTANPAFLEMTGLGLDQVVGRPLTDLTLEPWREAESALLADQVMVRGYSDVYEKEMLRAGGGGLPVSARLWLRMNENGVPRGLLGMFRDISVRKRQEWDLIQAKEAAEAANRAKNHFLANLSHEMRTPLNGVLGMLQLLELSELDQEQAFFVDTALASGRGLLVLISDLLDLSRIEAETMPIIEHEFSVEQVVRTIADTFRPQVKDRGLALDLGLDRSVPDVVLGDSGRVRQILFNLVGNAVKFTEKGSVGMQASLLPVRPGPGRARLLFVVSDTGIGIADQELKDVFNAFAQADGSYSRRFQGAGLGLSIVRGLVSRMNGAIAVDSEPGRGTRVFVTVEVGLVEAAPASDLVASARALAGNRGLSVLVAEDSEVNRVLVERLLHGLGHSVTTARDGVEALEAMAQDRFDLVIMDVQMPDMDGVEATRLIRSGSSGRCASDVPIIGLSAHVRPEEKDSFLSAGMNDFLAKPLEKDRLRE